MKRKQVTIGQIARQAEVSVRTLRYYDEIGLLKPSGRTEAGYRVYSTDDLAKLRQLRALCQLGFSLDEVRRFLDSGELTPERLVELHLDRVEAQLESLTQVRDRLHRLSLHLQSGGPETGFFEKLEGIMMLEQYYTPEQLKWLEKRHQEVGPERVKEVEAEWAELFEKFGQLKADGVDPESEMAQTLAARAKGLVQEFTAGNPEIASSLSSMYHHQGGEAVLQHHGCSLEPGVWDYMVRCMAKNK